ELAAQNHLVLHELSPQRASLEEAFMRLTAESVEYHAGVPGVSGVPVVPAPSDQPAPEQQPAWGADWQQQKQKKGQS
ncbi:MAG: type transport system ATP-binding protein, partial [Streptomyces sp.]|nr:type transport system ATP-binding protein [Streptomyces sp.]